MASGWRYRSESVLGTLLITAIALTVANTALLQGFVTTRVPVIAKLSAEHLSNGRLLLVYFTSLVVLLAAMAPLFKPRPRRILDTVLVVQKRVLIGLLALATIGYFDYSYRLPRATLIIFGSVVLVVLPTFFVGIRRSPDEDGPTIIVGDDPSAMADLYESIDGNVKGYVAPPLGNRRFLSDGGQMGERAIRGGSLDEHLPRLGGLSRLDEVLLEYDVATAHLGFSSSDRSEFFGALDACHEHGVGAKVHRDHVDNVLIDNLGDGPIVNVEMEPLDFQDYLMKRVFDVVFATVGLLVLLPLIGIIVIAIKLDSRGPVLYKQSRTAEFGDTFSVYKFRSMIPDAEAATGAKLSDEDAGDEDPRVTRVGKVLRQTHLDEIPQLWSILVGDMSTVGPRPERPEWDPEMKSTAVEWRKRWFVKPGLTGLAQINDVTGFEPVEKLRYDIEYIRRQSFWFDVKIVIRQIWMVAGDVLKHVLPGSSPEGEQ